MFEKIKQRPAGAAIERLSQREYQIVCLLRAAKSNKQIAYELHTSEGTVNNVLTKLYRRFGVDNRTDLALKDIRRCEICGSHYFQHPEQGAGDGGRPGDHGAEGAGSDPGSVTGLKPSYT